MATLDNKSSICPFGLSNNNNNNNIPELHYASYLQLDKLLTAQTLASASQGAACHEEMLFIIVHQVYELWFKLILYELDSVCEIFQAEVVNERNQLKIVQRLNRVVMILKLIIDQFPILETMTPQEFMEFRDILAPASGFQSVQFRKLEIKLGLKERDRIGTANAMIRQSLLPDENKTLEEQATTPSLLSVIDRWLARTPGLNTDTFCFMEEYKLSLEKKFAEEQKSINKEEEGKLRDQMLKSLEKRRLNLNELFDTHAYNELYASGRRKLTQDAMMGALMIYIYRNIPRFSQPFQIITLLVDIDTYILKWRYAHCSMAQRMIGSNVGTGSSSGYSYLRATVSDHYKVFNDLSNLATYLIPAQYIPTLPAQLVEMISVPMI